MCGVPEFSRSFWDSLSPFLPSLFIALQASKTFNQQPPPAKQLPVPELTNIHHPIPPSSYKDPTRFFQDLRCTLDYITVY